jgi:hypothetical protein
MQDRRQNDVELFKQPALPSVQNTTTAPTPPVDEPTKKEKPKKEKKEKSSKGSKKSTTSSSKNQYFSQTKRQLEMEAYAAVVTAFRIQGELTWKKENLLQELRAVLKVSDERHRMEIKRAEETISANPQLNPKYVTIAHRGMLIVNRKHKRSGDAVDDEEPYESIGSEESASEEEKQAYVIHLCCWLLIFLRRKKHKANEVDLAHLTAHVLPNSDSQPAYLTKLNAIASGKVSGKGKKKEGKEPTERKKGRKKKGETAASQATEQRKPIICNTFLISTQ